MQCNNCSQELVPGAEFCGNCGAKLLNAAPATPQPAVQTVPPQPALTPTEPAVPAQPVTPVAAPVLVAVSAPATAVPAAPGAYAVARSPKSGFSITSLVLGICSIITFFFIFTSFILGILAIVFGILGIKKGSKGLAISGIVLGIIGLLIGILLVFGIVAISNHCKENPTAKECKESTSSQFILPTFFRD